MWHRLQQDGFWGHDANCEKVLRLADRAMFEAIGRHFYALDDSL